MGNEAVSGPWPLPYWSGNAAKASIIAHILTVDLARKPRLTVFDYGCGDGGDWPRILADYPAVSLVGYDPSPSRIAIARRRFKGLGVCLYEGDEVEGLCLQADVVVSFSVFEHVKDRRSYLVNAKRLLAGDGRLFLNYDDGHFRTALEFGGPNKFRAIAGESLRNVWSWLGVPVRYQRRCKASDVDLLVQAAGFEIESTTYNNLDNFKSLFKTIPQSNRASFMQFWLGIERSLNANYAVRCARPVRGDHSNLWKAMLSRTLVCRHADTKSTVGR